MVSLEEGDYAKGEGREDGEAEERSESDSPDSKKPKSARTVINPPHEEVAA